ncbi:unnamed protein product [Protopolystoma xenopodis]|uniref:Uncharacterized protein n=1 Tax=Protopolystoma xenopodis TaxID=117903 RepID=A0A448XFF1_9PLAT|nr:unnamed protein product [Protopolystoma xenopodis]
MWSLLYLWSPFYNYFFRHQVEYRYSLLVCSPIPSPSELWVTSDGVLVAKSAANSTTSGIGILPPTSSSSPPPSSAGSLDPVLLAAMQAQTACAPNGLFLRVTHFVQLDGESVWTKNPAISVGPI